MLLGTPANAINLYEGGAPLSTFCASKLLPCRSSRCSLEDTACTEPASCGAPAWRRRRAACSLGECTWRQAECVCGCVLGQIMYPSRSTSVNFVDRTYAEARRGRGAVS